ncbi:MAG TPA: hypothetical protein VGW32_04310, partial [Pyrinomonadaceae bacterium]|nr:hypothetical protein [Pyrinomonadaceae bacterium]
MRRLRSGIRDLRSSRFMTVVVSAVIVAAASMLFAADAFARVGGGQGYGGGGGGGDGDGEGLGVIIYLVFRLLLWLTIEYPAIGIPLDIIVIGGVIYWFARRSKKPASVVSSSPVLGLSTGPGGRPQQDIQRAFNQQRRFDPNFSEIIFTDFCYALYGRAHDARGKGQAALDGLSPYLSDAARASLFQLNSPQLKAVQGIIVGAMQVADMRGLTTPTVEVSLEFEANYTEFTPREGDPRGEM